VSFRQQKISQGKQSADTAVKNAFPGLRAALISALHGAKAQSQTIHLGG
jgi:hypothetical protein